MENLDPKAPTVTATIGTQPYKTSIKWENGEIIADEPIDKGGSGLYPNPFSLLAASLASCTLITLRMYIDRKKWAIETISVEISIDHQQEGIETKTKFIKRLNFSPEIPEDQVVRLQLIASKCPIAKILSGDIEIITI